MTAGASGVATENYGVMDWLTHFIARMVILAPPFVEFNCFILDTCTVSSHIYMYACNPLR